MTVTVTAFGTIQRKIMDARVSSDTFGLVLIIGRRHRGDARRGSQKKYFEQARWEHFTERSRTWAAVNQHRDFLEAAREAAMPLDAEAKSALLQHLEAAEKILETLDPIGNLSTVVPSIPDPRPEDLKPFIGNWSPHGPDRH